MGLQISEESNYIENTAVLKCIIFGNKVVEIFSAEVTHFRPQGNGINPAEYTLHLNVHNYAPEGNDFISRDAQ